MLFVAVRLLPPLGVDKYVGSGCRVLKHMCGSVLLHAQPHPIDQRCRCQVECTTPPSTMLLMPSWLLMLSPQHRLHVCGSPHAMADTPLNTSASWTVLVSCCAITQLAVGVGTQPLVRRSQPRHVNGRWCDHDRRAALVPVAVAAAPAPHANVSRHHTCDGRHTAGRVCHTITELAVAVQG